jgi:hypothetical protein
VDDKEGVEDVFGSGAGQAVEVEHGGVEFGAEHSTAFGESVERGPWSPGSAA